MSAPTEAGAGVVKTSGTTTLERIPRKVWDAMGGVNNPDLILRHAKRGPDRYYIVRRTVAQS